MDDLILKILIFVSGMFLGSYVAFDYLDREDEEDEQME